MNKLITSAAVGAAILAGSAAVVAVPAYAQSPDQGQQQGSEHKPDQGSKNRGKHVRHRAIKGAIKTASETIGIDAKELVEQLRAGKSVAEVATEHGVDPQAVVDAIVAKVNAWVDEAVAAGKLDAEKAAQIKEKAPEKVAKMVNAHREPGQGKPGQGKPDQSKPDQTGQTGQDQAGN